MHVYPLLIINCITSFTLKTKKTHSYKIVLMFVEMTSCMIFNVPHFILSIQIFLKLLFTFNIYKFLKASTFVIGWPWFNKWKMFFGAFMNSKLINSLPLLIYILFVMNCIFSAKALSNIKITHGNNYFQWPSFWRVSKLGVDRSFLFLLHCKIDGTFHLRH